MKLNYISSKQFILLFLLSFTFTMSAQDGSISSSNALSFDGGDDYLQTASMPTLTTEYTMMAWIKPSNVSSLQTLFGWGSNSPANSASFLRIESSKLATNQANIVMSGATTLTAGQWVHVALTRNGNDFKIYLNGVLDYSGTQNANTNVNVFTIGNMLYGGSNYFRYNGVMDEFSVWNTELSGASISSYKESELTGSESGLVLYYNFNQGTANEDNTSIASITDSSSSSNDANINNLTLNGTTSNFVRFDGTVLGLSNNSLNELSVFPNPTRSELTVIFKTPSNSKISLYNVTGQKVLNNIEHIGLETKINTSTLKTGVYLLEIKNDNTTTYKKIVKI